jgi:hypothetical protein
MPTVLVTVRGPQRTVDLEMPGDTPISELFPLLLEVTGAPVLGSTAFHEEWGLGPVHGTPLPSTRTLIDCSIVDGSILLFQDASAWAEHLYAIGPATLVPTQPVPNDTHDTGGISIRWNKDSLLS